MPGWDYSGNGHYFITVIVQNRRCLLGKIENDKMIFSDFGEIANMEWYKSFEIRNELILDEFKLMPNHFHAIIIIDKSDCTTNLSDSDDPRGDLDGDSHDGSYGDSHDGSHVQTHGRASLPDPQPHQSKFQRKPESLSSFIAGYKSAVTSKIDDFIDLHNLPIAKYNRNNKFWHPNYHDHIIRDEDEYWRIKNYIKNNPKNWNEDTLGH